MTTAANHNVASFAFYIFGYMGHIYNGGMVYSAKIGFRQHILEFLQNFGNRYLFAARQMQRGIATISFAVDDIL